MMKMQRNHRKGLWNLFLNWATLYLLQHCILGIKLSDFVIYFHIFQLRKKIVCDCVSVCAGVKEIIGDRGNY